MTSVTGFTADHMQEIEDTTIVSGHIAGNNLILVTRAGTEINAGDVRGIQGIQGLPGATSIAVVTSTTRPVGAARFTGLAIYETDTKLLYIWDGASWIYRGGTIICTSSTRPAAPFAGLEIYETDTNQKLIHNGVRFDKPWNMPWGLVPGGYASVVAAQGSLGAQVDLAGLTVSPTFVANRRHLIHVEADFTSAIAGDVIVLYILKDGVQIDSSTHDLAKANSNETMTVETIDTPTAGAHTYKAAAQRVGTGASSMSAAAATPAHIRVEDIGSNGVPA